MASARGTGGPGPLLLKHRPHFSHSGFWGSISGGSPGKTQLPRLQARLGSPRPPTPSPGPPSPSPGPPSPSPGLPSPTQPRFLSLWPLRTAATRPVQAGGSRFRGGRQSPLLSTASAAGTTLKGSGSRESRLPVIHLHFWTHTHTSTCTHTCIHTAWFMARTQTHASVRMFTHVRMHTNKPG